MNVSSTIEVIDFQTGISIKQIPMFTDNGSSRQPRHIAFYENKAYVCSFDGTVARIDTTSLQIESFTKAGVRTNFYLFYFGERFDVDNGDCIIYP